MKIVRFVYEWPPPWIGLAPAPYELTKAQNELSNLITVFCARWPKAGPLKKISGVKIFTFFREPVMGTLLLTSAPLMTLSFLFWRLFNRVDVYHIHGHFGLYVYIYKFIFGFLDKTPIVAHFHNTVRGRKEELKKQGKEITPIRKFLDWPLAELSDRLAVKMSKACIFVSESLKEQAVLYYKVDPRKCYVLESGVNTKLFRQFSDKEKEDAKRRLGYSQSDVLILNDGFFVERKNIHLLIEALKYLPLEYKLMLVGKSELSYKQRLDSLIDQFGLGDRVKFLGEKNYEDIPDFLRASDLYVLPSSYEGFPKTVLQSLACGVPSIASGFSLPLITGLYELTSLDAKLLADKIREVSSLNTPVDTFSVSEKYSWDVRAKKLQSIYNTLND